VDIEPVELPAGPGRGSGRRTKAIAGESSGLPGIFVLDDDAYCAFVVPRKARGFTRAARRSAIDACVARTAVLARAELSLLPSSSIPAVLAVRGTLAAPAAPAEEAGSETPEG
jgi:hypothetical protein